MPPRVVERLDRAATPRHHRYGDALGEVLRRDLVSEPAHDVRFRSDEDDTQALAELGERRVLGDEPPSHPRGVGARRHQGLLEARVVEVTALPLAVAFVDKRRRAEIHGLVGLAHEHRAPVRRGEQGDRA